MAAESILRSLDGCGARTQPFRHWRLRDVLPADLAQALSALPFAAADIADTYGKRASHNSTRQFFGAETLAAHRACRELAEAFQNPSVVARINALSGAVMDGANLRVEYCLDRDGFWLEPHTDIDAKRFTMLLYLTQGPGAETLGTDLYDQGLRQADTASAAFNSAFFFIPAADTWHGFEKRPIPGVRRSLMINYVGPEWRARHELCFPDQPVTSERAPAE
ncbi:MAG: hypothetical protein KIS81_03300 [Maricaulaceae bacterium]|nr:hypothetical protein [Maricaulaceae bacterium]